MKKKTILLCCALLCMALLCACKSEEQIAQTAQPQSTVISPDVHITQEASERETLTVSGEGEVKLTPDLATVSIMIKTTQKQAEDAQQKNAELTDAVLASLKANGVQLAVFSNKADALAKEVVKDYFGTQYFTIVRGQMTGVAPKPAAEGTNALLQTLHADPASTLYVGDSNVDVETAHNANLPCCGAVWGFRTREELNAAGAEYLAENSDELYDVIMK